MNNALYMYTGFILLRAILWVFFWPNTGKGHNFVLIFFTILSLNALKDVNSRVFTRMLKGKTFDPVITLKITRVPDFLKD